MHGGIGQVLPQAVSVKVLASLLSETVLTFLAQSVHRANCLATHATSMHRVFIAYDALFCGFVGAVQALHTSMVPNDVTTAN